MAETRDATVLMFEREGAGGEGGIPGVAEDAAAAAAGVIGNCGPDATIDDIRETAGEAVTLPASPRVTTEETESARRITSGKDASDMRPEACGVGAAVGLPP